MALRIECCGASRQQDGRSINEDAFVIGRGKIPYAVLCDGAGNAHFAAKRAIALFERLLKESDADQLAQATTWQNWIKLLDSSLLGANQSTFIGIAHIDGKIIVGACAGDSRAYIIDRDGNCRILTEEACKYRLGSGSAKAFPISTALWPGDILLLMSDGAWTPLSIYTLKKTVLTARVCYQFADLPQAILDAAGRTGRADDMTAVAIRAI